MNKTIKVQKTSDHPKKQSGSTPDGTCFWCGGLISGKDEYMFSFKYCSWVCSFYHNSWDVDNWWRKS